MTKKTSIILAFLFVAIIFNYKRNKNSTNSNIDLMNIKLLAASASETSGKKICTTDSGICMFCEGFYYQWNNDGPWVSCAL